jgi:uncharacterized protein with FMN-binding domain
MKRAPLLVLAGTVAGFVGVLTFHTRPVSATTPGISQPTATPSTSSAASSSAAPGRSAGPAPTPAVAGGNTAGGHVPRSVVGQSVQFGYGVLDVRVTVSGNHITDISVPNLRTAEPTSQQISEQAIPMLRSEVLSAQSASVNGISGATYTSQAYVQSLQAALDKLHVK